MTREVAVGNTTLSSPFSVVILHWNGTAWKRCSDSIDRPSPPLRIAACQRFAPD